jgi:predicted TIM-barrel fold metal-dependent hydrolase
MINKIYFGMPQIYNNRHINITPKKNNINNNIYKTVSSESYRANFLTFSGHRNLIDAHAHIGEYLGLDCNLRTLEEYSRDVAHVAVSNLSALNLLDPHDGSHYLTWSNELNPKEINQKLLTELEQLKDKSKFLPLAFCQPHNNPTKNKEMSKQLDEFLSGTDGKSFYGLKLHPHFSNIHLIKDIDRIKEFIDIALKHDLPIFFHTQPEANGGNSDCIAICEFMNRLVEKDEKYKKVPIVLYHMNLGQDVDRRRVRDSAVKALENGVNLYLETSWVPMNDIVEAIKAVGPKRVIFGTDAPLANISSSANEIEKAVSDYETFYGKNGINEILKCTMKDRKNPSQYLDDVNNLTPQNVLEQIFYSNSQKLFKLKD